MAIAMLMEAPGDAHPGAYDAVNEKMNVVADPPAGLIAHTAGRAENGNWRIFDIWESQEAFDEFNDERLMPALREVIGDQAQADPDVQEIYELHTVIRP